MKLFILYQTDVHKRRFSRVCFGVYATFDLANQAAKDNELYNSNSNIEIIKIMLNEFVES